MFKKKQSRFSVSIPYKLQENTLWIQPITCPEQCPCCNEKDPTALGKHKYEHAARYSQSSTGTKTITNSFPLKWEVPYCVQCQEHMETAENWQMGILVTCFLVSLILVLAIDASSTMLFLLMYGLFIIGGLILYKVIVETVVKRQQKSTCVSYKRAFWASSPPIGEHKIVFNFETEEYARNFATLN